MPIMGNAAILERMTDLAAERQQLLARLPSSHLLGHAAGYIRVSGRGFRAVSVAEDAPLSRFANGPTRELETALAQAGGDPRRVDPELQKDERCVQAHIIRRALENRGDLLPVFGAGVPFEELWFAFDEVRLYSGDDGASGTIVRCDLVAVGKSCGQFEPVLIELKYARGETRLLEQFANFERIVVGERCRARFAAMLAAATDRAPVSLAHFHRLIVWPAHHPHRAQKQAQIRRLLKGGIRCIGYELTRRPGRLPAVRDLSLEKPEVEA